MVFCWFFLKTSSRENSTWYRAFVRGEGILVSSRRGGRQIGRVVREKAREIFGHAEFRAGQESVVRAILDGRNALAVFPTGGGKSLCYQLPAVLLEGVTLAVSPLIALMKEQVENARNLLLAVGH